MRRATLYPLGYLVLASLIAALPLLPATSATSVQAQLAIWQAQKISTYAFDYQRSCYCPPFDEKVRITVVDGQIAAVHDARTGAPIGRDRWSHYRTIDDLFRVLLSAEAGGAELIVSYHPTFGYPVESYIDYDESIIDDEITYWVTALSLRPMIPRLYLPSVFTTP